MDETNIDVYHNAVTYSTLREINCTIHWFKGWNPRQRDCFMKDLVTKALPNNIDFLMDNMDAMNMNDKAPSLFECQLKLFTQWFDEWDEHERNVMLERLESTDPTFVSRFKECIKNPSLMS